MTSDIDAVTANGKAVFRGDTFTHKEKVFTVIDVGVHPTSSRYSVLKIENEQTGPNGRWISVHK